MVGGNKGLLSHSRTINIPPYDVLLMWLEHHIKNYNDSIHHSYNRCIFKIALRLYVSDKVKNNIDNSRLFNLIYNNNISVYHTAVTATDLLEHLKNLPNRNIYEIIVNDFI